MRILSLILLSSLLFFGWKTGHPHGPAFQISCNTCHSTKGWQLDSAYSFNHNATALPLTGQHKSLNCRFCHPTLIFSEAKAECISCHADIHQSTAGPDCGRCHTPKSWLVENITGMHRLSRFPLLGAHRTADCFDCHKSENHSRFDITGIECIDCHRKEFMSATNPNHAESGFSEDCTSCHPVNAFQWEGAGFNHSFFPLLLGHSGPKCSDCHKTGSYSGISPECNSCHHQDYLSAANPDHSASNFPVTCEACHNLNPGWKPANFDHSVFPLTQGHSGLDCTNCHKNGNFNATSPECYSCHTENFNSTTNPNHNSLGFSTVCTECHTTNPGWKPASFKQHDPLFPIYSGRHKGQWNSCSQCHPDASAYAQFSCLTCHEHNQASMDNAHSEQSGYSYVSSACLSCHPRGNAE